MNTWLEQLDEVELQLLAPILFFCRENQEQAASYLCKDGPISPMASAEEIKTLQEKYHNELTARPPKTVWENVKKEMCLLIYTNDEKYAELRQSLNKLSSVETSELVLRISTHIGRLLGEREKTMTSFCAVILYSILNSGKASFCTQFKGYTHRENL